MEFRYLCRPMYQPRHQKMRYLTLLFSLFFISSCTEEVIPGLEEEQYNWQDHYTKEETYIEMRDGVKLFTVIYAPKDTSHVYPVILKRTPYSCKPYGADTLPSRISHDQNLVEAGYIFIMQDVRGRWMSEGHFENTKPPYSFFDSTKTDEITDTWDTFDWLDENLDHYNGRAGMYGTSYPGWTTLVGARSNHPSLKAVLAMAPVTNFYFEDFNRYGLFALNYLPVLHAFGTQKDAPSDTSWYDGRSEAFGFIDSLDLEPDYYDFFRKRLALTNFDDVLDSTNFFWQNIQAHPDYDEYRQKRDWIQYFDTIQCQVMVAGGWNDEQNLYGILNSYKKIESHVPADQAQFVMGPWSHGHPVRGDSAYYLGNVFYGYNLSKHFMDSVEFPYFEYHLKDKGEKLDFKVKLFDTGLNEWSYFKSYPHQMRDSAVFYLNGDALAAVTPEEANYRTYVSDPHNPVPYVEGDKFYIMAPKPYFTADQRFVSKRPDVISFETEPLSEDLTVLGEVKAIIDFATSLNDADVFVKIIDGYPMDRKPLDTDPEGVKMNGYQQLVRAGYIRGRYRTSFEKGMPFVSNKKTEVQVPLLDIYHTFKKGHRIIVQVQSSMFPLFDMNPQNYVNDIYQADKADFAMAIHRIFNSSRIIMPIKK